MNAPADFRLLCTAKFRNLAAARPRGSQIFGMALQGERAHAVGVSCEFAPAIDTQHFVHCGGRVALLHHQAHKQPGRTGVEVVDAQALFEAPTEAELLATRLALPQEKDVAFASSLAFDAAGDCLAVGLNGHGFRGEVLLYEGVAAASPRLAARIDLHALGHERPAGMAFMNGELWVASYSGGCVSVFADPLRSGRPRRVIGGLSAPIGLHAQAGVMHVTAHLSHQLARFDAEGALLDMVAPGFDHPWGVTWAAGRLLVAGLELRDEARSRIWAAPQAAGPWKPLDIPGDADLRGFSALSI